VTVPARGAAAALALSALVCAPSLGGCGAAAGARQVARVAAAAPPSGLPDGASPGLSARVDGLVDGMPAVVPVPVGAHVTTSAVQARGALLAVSVTGTSTLAVPALLAGFRDRLLAEGFTATDDSLLPRGAAGAAYGRPGGRELLLVAVVDRGGTRSWSVGGTVAPVLPRPG